MVILRTYLKYGINKTEDITNETLSQMLGEVIEVTYIAGHTQVVSLYNNMCDWLNKSEAKIKDGMVDKIRDSWALAILRITDELKAGKLDAVLALDLVDFCYNLSLHMELYYEEDNSFVLDTIQGQCGDNIVKLYNNETYKGYFTNTIVEHLELNKIQ